MKEKYDKIGLKYNTTRKADPFLTEKLFYFLNPQKGVDYLDIGCGTGNYTIALHQKGINLVGIDPSIEMLKIAKAKSSTIDWRIGIAEKIPLENNFISGAIATLTIHHWRNLSIGFKELSRVLKPGASLVIFTSTSKQMKGYWLNHYFPKMLADSIMQMPKLERIEKELKSCGFEIDETEPYFVKNDLQDLFLYAGKDRPRLYLNEEIRRGISSFSALAHRDEVERGLKMLKEDIISTQINEVKEKFRNKEGDYIFISCKKIVSR